MEDLLTLLLRFILGWWSQPLCRSCWQCLPLLLLPPLPASSSAHCHPHLCSQAAQAAAGFPEGKQASPNHPHRGYSLLDSLQLSKLIPDCCLWFYFLLTKTISLGTLKSPLSLFLFQDCHIQTGTAVMKVSETKNQANIVNSHWKWSPTSIKFNIILCLI